MSRYIDADNLEHKIIIHRRIVIHKDDILSIIADIPTEEVSEIVHGKWGDSGDEVHYCSNCNMDALFIGFVQILTDYCPHCGAKMDL